MSRYDAVVKMWQDRNIRTVDDLALRLDNFRILFAYNSGKIENAEINYHDTREIFENGKVVGYTGSTRTLFEQQNQKVCYDFLQDKIIAKEPLSIELICAVHRALTEGTHDERRYIVNGERPGEFKKHDYVTGKNEVGSQPDEVKNDLAELIEEVNAIERVPSGAGPNVGRAAVFAEIAYIRAKLLRDRNGSAAADTLGWSELRHAVHHLHGIFNMNDGAVLADVLRAKRQQLL